MRAEARTYTEEALPGSTSEGRRAASPVETVSLPDAIARLIRDGLELLTLESRAAALSLALLVFLSVAAASFALFAWFGLSAIGVVALVDAGYSVMPALGALAGINAALAVGAGLLVKRLTMSITFGMDEHPGEDGERRD